MSGSENARPPRGRDTRRSRSRKQRCACYARVSRTRSSCPGHASEVTAPSRIRFRLPVRRGCCPYVWLILEGLRPTGASRGFVLPALRARRTSERTKNRGVCNPKERSCSSSSDRGIPAVLATNPSLAGEGKGNGRRWRSGPSRRPVPTTRAPRARATRARRGASRAARRGHPSADRRGRARCFLGR